MTEERVIQAAHNVLDETRKATDSLMMSLYWQVIKTFISPVLIMIVTAMVVNYTVGVVEESTDNALVRSTVMFVGLVIGFLLAHAVWQLMERRHRGVALAKAFLAVARSMVELRRLLKRQQRGEFVATVQVEERIEAVDQCTDRYLAAMEEAGRSQGVD